MSTLKINTSPHCQYCERVMGVDDGSCTWNQTMLPVLDGDVLFRAWSCSERCLRKVLNKRQKERKCAQ